MRDVGVWATDQGVVRGSQSGQAPFIEFTADGRFIDYHNQLPEDAVKLVRADDAQAVSWWLTMELLWSALGFTTAGAYSRDAYNLAARVVKAEAGADRLAQQCDQLMQERDALRAILDRRLDGAA